MNENINMNPGQHPAALLPEFEIENGHYLVRFADGRHAMVDTGCPITFGRGGDICISGNVYPLTPNDRFLASINDPGLLKTHVDIVLGGDILRRHRVEFDLCSGLISIDENTGVRFDHQLPVRFVGGHPVVDLVLNGQSVSALFDQGAYIGYVRKELVQDCAAVGELSDFCGMAGVAVTVTARRITAQFCGVELQMELCEAPAPVLQALNQTRTQATFGPNVVDFDILALDLGRNRIEFDHIGQR